MTCGECSDRETCKTPCKDVNKILWAGNHVMERHYQDNIVVYPGSGREVHFCELTDKQLDEISDGDIVTWASEDWSLRKTKVFIEHFFNRTPYRDLARIFGVKENTVVTMYKQASEQIQTLVKAMDARAEGIKAVQTDRFNDDEKMFLLVYVFGFNQTEVGRMFGKDNRVVSARLKPMADKYEKQIRGNSA
ncbi:MAG: Sigma-70, region 4 [Syntrophus sp. PtaU1.Bin005]|nr:MAG: Sigma-70, region 4 [Syntrophus sp. PtaU1.Bin005]